ncbi:formylglycine-generating enzyme family protein [Paeniglutamicibacter cryotolerans]|uniref:formylglycine-generating enzyme family protein n=1 Tax=Paeniglutamicibacter cryotolerans TaxID=670079 RepID=UPI0016168319
MAACCTPARGPSGAPSGAVPPVLPGSGAHHEQVLIGPGSFLMGDAFNEGYASDGELPVHRVGLDAFSIDATAVTNTQFARFIDATGYRTEAQVYGSSAVFHLLVNAPARDVLGPVPGAGWWITVRGADWAHPFGANSAAAELPDHPVVHVSHNDALAYCAWSGRLLPTEAQWEYAARGGLESARYAWGDELLGPGGEHRANIWQGTFPTINTTADGFLGTAPVRSFAANGYGLYEMAGNVWEWCGDWFLPRYYARSGPDNPPGPPFGTGRVMRGGSYLCHDSYCNRYRVAARSSNTPDSSSGNCGFRTVAA